MTHRVTAATTMASATTSTKNVEGSEIDSWPWARGAPAGAVGALADVVALPPGGVEAGPEPGAVASVCWRGTTVAEQPAELATNRAPAGTETATTNPPAWSEVIVPSVVVPSSTRTVEEGSNPLPAMLVEVLDAVVAPEGPSVERVAMHVCLGGYVVLSASNAADRVSG